jgi:hypothetical protein
VTRFQEHEPPKLPSSIMFVYSGVEKGIVDLNGGGMQCKKGGRSKVWRYPLGVVVLAFSFCSKLSLWMWYVQLFGMTQVSCSSCRVNGPVALKESGLGFDYLTVVIAARAIRHVMISKKFC